MAEAVGCAEPDEGVLDETHAPGALQRLACIVAAELPGLGHQGCCAHDRLLRNADGDRRRFHPELQTVDRLLVTTVELVRHLAVELDPDLPRLRGAHELRLVGAADRGADERARPLGDPLGGDHAELEPSVVGAGVVERLDAAEHLAARCRRGCTRSRRRTSGLPSTSILARKGRSRRCLAPVHTYAARPNRSLSARSASRIISASRPVPAMTANRSPLTRPTSIVRRAPCNADVDRGLQVDRDAEVAGEQVAGTRRQDRQRDGRVADRVDAALDHAVAAPHEQEVGAVAERRAARTSVRTCSSTPRTRSGRRRRRRPALDAAPTGHRRGSCPRAPPPRPTVIRPPPRVGGRGARRARPDVRARSPSRPGRRHIRLRRNPRRVGHRTRRR